MNQEYISRYQEAVEYLGVQSCPVPTEAQVEKMRADGWLVESENPEEKFSLKVQNLVMCTNLVSLNGNPIFFNLVRICDRLKKYGAISRKAFKSVIFSIDSPEGAVSAVVILYSRGAVLVMGIRTEDEFYQAICKIIRILSTDSELGIGPMRMENTPRIINMVSSGSIPSSTNLDTLLRNYPDFVTMRKQQFSGATITLMTNGSCACKKIVGLAFDSEKFVVNGYRQRIECQSALYILLFFMWSSRTIKRKKRQRVDL